MLRARTPLLHHGLPADASGEGYNWSHGEGAVSSILQVTGEGFNDSHAEGVINSILLLSGQGWNHSYGLGSLSSSTAQGDGWNHSYGQGEANLILAVTGEGYNWSHGNGEILGYFWISGQGWVWNYGEEFYIPPRIISRLLAGEFSIFSQTKGRANIDINVEGIFQISFELRGRR
jgi:hypothetical protein